MNAFLSGKRTIFLHIYAFYKETDGQIFYTKIAKIYLEMLCRSPSDWVRMFLVFSEIRVRCDQFSHLIWFLLIYWFSRKTNKMQLNLISEWSFYHKRWNSSDQLNEDSQVEDIVIVTVPHFFTVARIDSSNLRSLLLERVTYVAETSSIKAPDRVVHGLRKMCFTY